MSELTRYPRPWPSMTDEATGGERLCGALHSSFGCTRKRGHGGRHEAGGPRGQMVASWPAEDGACPCADGIASEQCGPRGCDPGGDADA